MFKIMLPKFHLEIERWKFNKNYNIYVSNLGNFKDKTKEDIKLMIQKNGYLTVPLCNNKKGTVKYIPAHRIVMETWCPKANIWKDKLTVDHLNHNKRDNRAKNLEWVTKEENQRRANEDLITDDKDITIQSLKSRISNLENQLNNKTENNNIIITMIDFKEFYSWESLKNWLIKNINSNIENMAMKNLKKQVLKAIENKTKYMGYYWKISK